MALPNIEMQNPNAGGSLPNLTLQNPETGEYVDIQMQIQASDEASAAKAEAWAVGERGGVPVSSTDPTYHNNAKYYAQAAEDAAETASAAYGTDLLAPTYSASKTYAIGDHVIYDGGYYACNTAITTAEAWTAAHWTKLAVGGEVSDLKSAFALFQENIPGTVQTIAFDSAGNIQSVTHKENNVVVRTDVFTFAASTITEVRTLASGESLTIVTNTDTLETTTTYAAA